MKTSELIAKLQKAVAEYGDLDILVRSVEDGDDWKSLTVWPEPASPMEAEDRAQGNIDINIF